MSNKSPAWNGLSRSTHDDDSVDSASQILDASTLAMNKSGSAAEPACRWPAPAMYPTHAMRSHRGRMIVEWSIRIGNIGPKKSPTGETATAFPTSERTTQTVTSGLDKRASDARQRMNRLNSMRTTYPMTVGDDAVVN